MGLEQLTVKEIADKAVRNLIDIPSIQREFAWRADKVCSLADSLFQKYPIGALLFWTSSDYHDARTTSTASATTWIVDGQQRVTALCLLLGAKPYWWPDAVGWDAMLQRNTVLFNIAPDHDDPRDFMLASGTR